MSKNKNNVLYSECICPVIITKEELYDFMYENKVDNKELNFQYAMLMYLKTDGVIIGALNHNKIVSFMIITFEQDYLERKKWCLIRYYYTPLLYGFEEYSINKMLSHVNKIAKKQNCNFIGFPRSALRKVKFNKEAYDKIFKHDFIKTRLAIKSIDGTSETINICKAIEYTKLDNKELTDEELIASLYQEYSRKTRTNTYMVKEKINCRNDKKDCELLKEIISLNGRIVFYKY